MNDTPIKLGDEACSSEDFAEALWRILAVDHYGLIDEEEDDEPQRWIEAIRAYCAVSVILRIARPSLGGDELELVGVVEVQSDSRRFLFWSSDGTGSVDLLPIGSSETVAMGFMRLMQDLGCNLCQIAGTEIVNLRPDFLSRKELAAAIDQMIEDQGEDWADHSDDEVATTESFLSLNYRER